VLEMESLFVKAEVVMVNSSLDECIRLVKDGKIKESPGV
jgi:hypothetical protein